MKMEAMHQVMINTTTNTKAGDDTVVVVTPLVVVVYGDVVNNTRPEMPVQISATNTLPMPSKKSPTMEIHATRPRFAHASVNAPHVAGQNGVPYTATKTRPLRLTCFMQHSTHHRQQPMQQNTTFLTVSFMPDSLALRSKYATDASAK